MSDNRAHLEEKYTWDLTTIFATDADWETEYESTVQDLKKASAYAGHLLDSAKNLLEATELYYEPYASLGENLCLCVNEK